MKTEELVEILEDQDQAILLMVKGNKIQIAKSNDDFDPQIKILKRWMIEYLSIHDETEDFTDPFVEKRLEEIIVHWRKNVPRETSEDEC